MLIAVLEYLLIFGFLMVKSEDLESWCGSSEHEGVCQHWASLWVVWWDSSGKSWLSVPLGLLLVL